MKIYFEFNFQTHNFWPIYEAIKTYYPIGLRYSYPSLYTEYEGQKKLGALLVDNFHNMENFKARYESFTTKLQEQFGLEVQGTSYGQQPSFSFDMILEKTELPELTKIKRISVAVSLLGDFYAIYGIDETMLKEYGNPYPYKYHAVNAITTSPYREFEEHFLKLKQAILERYPNHKQVPFAILTTYLEGVYNRFDETNESTIYNALFNQQLKAGYPYNIRGDQYYGFNEWKNEGITNADFLTVEVFAPPPADHTGIADQCKSNRT
jgi:hypothetical protein